MALIIEQLNRQGDVVALHKFQQGAVRLGRGYDNDLVLTDPHVSAHHARLEQADDGRWTLFDLASDNGSFDSRQRPVSRLELASGASFYLAECQFRLLDSQHPVVPAVPLNRAALRLNRLGHPLQLLVWFVLVFAFDLGEFWLNAGASEDAHWQQQLIRLPLYALALMAWPACLTFWSRFNHRHGYFRAQLALMLLATIAFSVWQLVNPWLSFNLNGPTWFYWLDESVTAALLFMLLLGNFTLALQQTTLRKLLICAGMVLLFSGQSVVQRLWQQDNPRLAPSYDETLLPAPWYVGTPQTPDAALTQAERLFEQAAANRQDKPN